MGSAGGTRMGATPPHYVCILIMCAVGVQGDDSPLSQLRQSIFFGYDRNVMPQVNGTDSDPLEVHLGLAPTWMDLDSNGVLEAIMWLRLTWSDYRLSWDPEDHENITVFRINPHELWKPDISLYNKQDLAHGILAADPRSANTNVHISSNGNILWVVPVSHKVLCEGVTYSNWPWGTQSCNLSFGSWTHDASSYDLLFYGDLEQMDLRQFGQYNQFKILKQEGLKEVKKYECCPNPYVKLIFMFSIKRKYVVDPDLGRVDNPEDTVK